MNGTWERPEWAGIAVRYAGGTLLTVQIAPVLFGRLDMTRDYDEIRSWDRGDPLRRIFHQPKITVELEGVVTDDAHWSRWRDTRRRPDRDLPAAVGELPGRRREIER